MKKSGLIAFAFLLFAACNNTGDETKTTDSTNVQNNTNVTTPAPPDTNSMNKMSDTGMKKDTNKKY